MNIKPLAEPHTFIKKEIVGKEALEAKKFLEIWGYRYRVSEEDGRPYILASDYDPIRFNLKIKNGKVVEYDLG
jgi:hypothetical protein